MSSRTINSNTKCKGQTFTINDREESLWGIDTNEDSLPPSSANNWKTKRREWKHKAIEISYRMLPLQRHNFEN